MDYQEFDVVMAGFEARFPDVSKWLRSTPDPAATLSVWRQAWQDLASADCIAAIDQIFTGAVPYPEPWSKFPATIRNLARSIGYKKSQQQAIRDQPAEHIPERSRHSMPAMLQTIRDSVDAGMTTDEALAVVNKKYPIADEDRARYRCLDCEDTGHVRVFNNRTVAAVWHGQPKVRKYSAVVLCSCRAGLKRHTDANGNVIDVTYMATYDRDKFCKYGNGDLDGLRLWIEKKQELAIANQGELPF